MPCLQSARSEKPFLLLFLLSLSVTACSSGDDDEPLPITSTPVTTASGIELRLDSLFYADGDSLTVVLDFGEVTPPSLILGVAVAGSVSGDVEAVILRADGAGRFVSTAPLTIAALSGAAEPADEVLSLAPNESFVAMYFIDKNEPSLQNIAEDWVVDMAMFEDDPANYADVDIEPELAATDDETTPIPGAKAVGTIIPRGGLPVQIATEELIVYPRDEAHLQAFLEESGGSVIASRDFVGEDGETTDQRMVLVSVDPSTADIDRLAQLRGFFGEDADLLASKSDALGIYYLALYYQLKGYVVAVNPRMQYHGAPDIAPTERGAVTHTMQMVGPTAGTPCVLGDPTNPCVENVPAAWTFSALWDADSRRVNVGILDIGFAPNADFRAPAGMGPWVECDMTETLSFSCGPGSAQGPPTVGNSFFGDKTWHGTGVVTTIGGVVSNNFGASGVGGQVVVPMMYKYDIASYAFEIGDGIRRATDDGASCINISGGLPCNVLTTIGPDFNICTAAGRTGLCSAIAGVLAVAVSTTCAVASVISIIFPPAALACPAAAVAGAFSTGACFATLAFGDLAGPMESAVWYAARAGVPVITSAGNTISPDKIPPVIRDYVDIENGNLDDWRVVPAAFPRAITVGAVDSALSNKEFFGSLVDIWAPIRSAYVSPQDVTDPMSPLVGDTIGGTSAAAPFITGLVANMQAMDPELDPHGPTVTDAERRTIVDRITAILTDEANSFSNAELAALGFANEPVARRLLVDPLAVLQATAAGRAFFPYVDFASQGFDASLNFSEVAGSDDTPAQATTLTFGETVTGTIATIPGDGSYTPPPDVDWYNFAMPTAANPNRAYTTNINIDFPQDPGDDSVGIPAASASVRLISRGAGLIYQAFRPSGTMLSFSLAAGAGDNVYKVSVDPPEVAAPDVLITSPTADQTLCAGLLIPFQALVDYPESFPMTVGADIPSSEIVWRDGATVLGTGRAINQPLTEGSHTISVRVFDDPALEDSITRTVETCVGSPPIVTIDTPPVECIPPAPSFIDICADGDQVDADGRYYEVALAATVTDPDMGDMVTFSWTTDRADVQPGGPTSGTQQLSTNEDAIVRLYTSCAFDAGFGTVDHVITFRATDTQGNTTTETILVRVRQLC